MQFFGALPTTSDVCYVATILWTGLLSRWCWLNTTEWHSWPHDLYGKIINSLIIIVLITKIGLFIFIWNYRKIVSIFWLGKKKKTFSAEITSVYHDDNTVWGKTQALVFVWIVNKPMSFSPPCKYGKNCILCRWNHAY